MSHSFKTLLVLIFLSGIIFALIGFFGLLFINKQSENASQKSGVISFEKFKSEEELREFIANTKQTRSFAVFSGMAPSFSPNMLSDVLKEGAISDLSATKERVSSTNIQISGIDEPDIVKTDGKNIFFSSQSNQIYRGIPAPLEENDISYPPKFLQPKTKIISAIPPQAISLTSEIEKFGDLIIKDDTLVIFENDKLTAYNITNASSPEKIWHYNFDENFFYKTARVIDDNIYLISNRYVNQSVPCPMPLFSGSENIKVSCTEIYHSPQSASAEVIYSITKINIKNGTIEDSITFFGQPYGLVFVSPNAIYTSFVTYLNQFEYLINFFNENRDFFNDELIEKINYLKTIDISNDSKLSEVYIILESYFSKLSDEERKSAENEFANRMDKYAKIHIREMENTTLVKINIDSLDVAATGQIPGRPLNQFSFDEWGGNIRIATTVSSSGPFSGTESANDLYILNEKLETIGQIQGLALGERIYSVRFIEDKAYIVTFKQIDPFFVIDLSDSTNPKLAGELKIPGYSSYLHPVEKNLILGVGQEEGKSKISLFNVSNPDNPMEIDKYILNEFYSELENNHHAFLLDPVHKVFFLPAGESGYVFKWEGGLAIKYAASNIYARRALYIGDYLYILGDNSLIVLNELNWTQESRLEL